MSEKRKCKRCGKTFPGDVLHGCGGIKEEVTAEISLMQNAVFVVKDGVLIPLQSPPTGYGQQTIHWESEKVTRIVHGHIQKV